ncbi:probable F-box protein At5g04010 [Rutidosis leptorrhynchoides]|uniref:probable F-box protein At5g04010 n=1 Tax=Rutidosis leptorrhynchoides TaxID=125765 RepID=UPI003A9949F8
MASSIIIPYQVLDLIANILDPKTLALASCVSKSWCTILSSDHLWEHLCTTHFPSLSHLRATTAPPLTFRRLFGLGCTATNRRKKQPITPKITLEKLLFIITLTNSNSPPVTLIRPGSSLIRQDSKPLFRFDIDVTDHEKWLKFNVLDETNVTWNVVLKGYESVFTMMDCKGKGSFVSGSDGWFSVELPAAGCCCASSSGGSSGMMAEMRLGMREESGKMVVERVSVGVLSIVSWRYVGVDDGLRYLQHFLEPCNV